MKQTTQEVINRMEIEFNELAGRIGSLERFLISKDYPEVTSNQKALLAQQHTAMEQYKEILLKRLVDLRYQAKREELMTKECSAPEEANKDERIEPHVFSAMEYEAHRQKTSPEAKDGTSAD